MSELSDIKKGLTRIEQLEKNLHLKQLQINRLLNITQAINNNVKADGLFSMYNEFLSWEMGIKKMALYVNRVGRWTCTSSIGISKELLEMDISDKLPQYKSLKSLDETDHPLISEFDVVIPVLHKESPIAFAFIGGFNKDDDVYNKVQFITTITNIIAVAIENKRLFKRQIEQERLKHEMELASDMQHMLVPSRLPKGDCYEMASIYKPHLQVGGDYFDCFETENLISFCVADISGKGLAAALLMSNFQASLWALIHKCDGLADFVRQLNESVLRITKSEKYLTFFVGEFDTRLRRLRYVNAGHIPPVLVKEGEVQLLDKGCTILGFFDELPSVEVGEVLIPDEAMVLTFTDGLTDIRNEGGDFFSEQLLQDFVKSHYKLSASEFNAKLMEFIDSFRGKQNYTDDLTVLTCKIFKKQS